MFLAGEFMPRERLLSGLALEQVTARPGKVPHSIYDELWQAAEWQQLVEKFLSGARRAAQWGETLDGSGEELGPGWSVADVLASLAAHNAYHLGKIVALRQMLGAWPPAGGDDHP